MEQFIVNVAKYARNNSIAKAAVKFNLSEDEVRAHKKTYREGLTKHESPLEVESKQSDVEVEKNDSPSVESLLGKIAYLENVIKHLQGNKFDHAKRLNNLQARMHYVEGYLQNRG